MSFKAKDGTPFSLKPMAAQHDARAEFNKSKSPALPKIGAPDDDAMESQDPSEVVAAHGPAVQVLIKHEGEKHSVKSKHEDGHTHTSEHASKEEAHDAGKTLAGADGSSEDSSDHWDADSSPMSSM